MSKSTTDVCTATEPRPTHPGAANRQVTLTGRTIRRTNIDRWGPLVGLAFLMAWTPPSWAAPSAKTYDLRAHRAPNQVDRVEGTLEVGGDQVPFDNPKAERPKLSVVAKLGYDEKLLELAEAGGPPVRSIRYYDVTDVVIKVGDLSDKPNLRSDRRLIGAATDGRRVTLFSPSGPLTRGELDLIDVLGNSLLLDRLLPDRPVAVGDAWSHPNELMAALFGLDEVTKCEVQSKLSTIKDNSAIIEAAGSVEGKACGASAAIEMKAKYRFDLRTRRINWFGLAVRENQSPGYAQHGIDVVARLQVQIAPKAQSERLSEAALAGAALNATPQSTQLSYQPPGGGWSFIHDRTWYVRVDEHDRAILRLIDGGQWVANCTVSPVAKAAADNDVTLEQFQEDIKVALGKSFGQLIKAGQWAGPTGYRIFRVEIQGTIPVELEGKKSDLPMEWHYYRVADDQGRQVAFAFTAEQSLVPRLGQADKVLVESLRFAEAGVAAKDVAPEPPEMKRSR
jgi:hypothetical protein